MPDTVMTKTTAIPKPLAVFIFEEQDRKEHMPRKLAKIKFSMKTD
jgi:hypothetical protein